jgi:hypothetical protein
LLKLKLGAAVHPNDYLPATTRHTPNPIIQMLVLGIFALETLAQPQPLME